MAQINTQTHEHSITFFAKIVPGSSKTAITGTWDHMLKLKVSAPPEKGKANTCIVKFLAKALGVKKQDVQILSGHTNPIKQIQVHGVSESALLLALFPKT